jgi:transcriptional regulator with GAF, ATPase, and Fis domain
MSDSFFIQHATGADAPRYTLRQRLFLVGSGSDNDIVLHDRGAPPVVFRIEPDDNRYRCTTVSKKRLVINGTKTKSALLVPGDVIEVDKEKYLFDHVPAASESIAGQSHRLFENLGKFIDAVGKERQLPPLLQKMIGILLELTGGTDIFLFKLDQDGTPQIFECNKRDNPRERFSDTIVQTVLKRKEGLCISNALADPAYKNSHSIADLKLNSVLCTPIMTAGKCIGLIYIGTNSPAISFSASDLECVNLYAAVAGMLFQHVDFITEQQNTIEKVTGNLDGDGLIATCAQMQKVTAAVHAIAGTDIIVLITGETGTGKNRIAELVHQHSPRCARPFVIVNCSALHGELLESELFGHRKGSFTGAINDHHGLFAAADGGTLLLDEIGELELPLQAKLLRTLETGAIRPIGSNVESMVDVRVICASNRDLAVMVEEKTFRADLYYRINQFSIPVPALRERGEDIVALAYFFMNRYKAQYPDKMIRDFHPDALNFIRTHMWPGNIREMANLLHRSVLMSAGPLLLIDYQENIQRRTLPANFEEATQAFQREMIEKAINAAGGNKEQAARTLGISRSTFYRYLSQ